VKGDLHRQQGVNQSTGGDSRCEETQGLPASASAAHAHRHLVRSRPRALESPDWQQKAVVRGELAQVYRLEGSLSGDGVLGCVGEPVQAQVEEAQEVPQGRVGARASLLGGLARAL